MNSQVIRWTSMALLLSAGVNLRLGAADGHASEPAIAPVTASPTVDTAMDLPTAITAFTADLYQRLSKRPGNLAWSPVSIHAALSMATDGARGVTRIELNRALHRTDSPEQATAWAQLRAELTSSTNAGTSQPHVLLSFAQALCVQKGLTLATTYPQQCRDVYGAEILTMDPLHDIDGTIRTINQWASEKTQGAIPTILTSDAITRDTRTVLVNAVHLQACWDEPFMTRLTASAPFTRSSAEPVAVPMMHTQRRLLYARTEVAHLVTLPYTSDLAMTVIVPIAVDGLSGIESRLDEATFRQLMTVPMKPTMVALALPRFTLAGDTLSLGGLLQSLGVTAGFDVRTADFTGIVTMTPPLVMSEVFHRCTLAVNEQGTEASAVTVISMRAGSAMRPETPIAVTADHPFLVVIRHQATGVILFLARVSDPSAP